MCPHLQRNVYLQRNSEMMHDTFHQRNIISNHAALLFPL